MHFDNYNKSFPSSGKQPYYYTARDGSPLTMAGLWDEWKDIETGEPLKSCTMIITNANELASKIHDRMPVLLRPHAQRLSGVPRTPRKHPHGTWRP